jgi:Ca-activated chloride channel family protein
MAQNTILPDDPRLTAYALDEMEPAERVEFEKYLQQDAAARQAVAEIRATVASLTTALAEEPWPTAIKRDLAQAAILPGMDPRRLDGGGSLTTSLSKRIKFPQFYYMVSGLAAACFAAFFVYWQENQPTHELKQYIEVPLVAAKDKSGAVAMPVDLPASEPESEQVRPAPSPMAQSRELNDNSNKAESNGGARAKESRPEASGYMQTMAKPATARTVNLQEMASLLRRERDANTEAYGYRKDNDYLRTADHPLSTFSADVDTASYANVRRFLAQGQRPPADAVRIEEMVNYFPYDYAGPRGSDSHGEVNGAPFAAHLEVAGAPWAPEHRLVRIGLKGREVTDASRPAANLVFLLDVSGSMNAPNKLPLVKQSLRMLVGKLRPDDRVAIAVYAGASGLALPSTPASHQAEILEAIDRLEAEGSTNGAMGIQLAYDVAKANFIPGGVNRVILATDGDFNVGVTGEGELVRLIAEKARSGVFLSVLGFGMGNLKDATLEQLAGKGNGNYAYIDSLSEARKSLVEQAGGTLVTIAKDVKLQVEFNPAVVQAYRLIGYENRLLAKEDFNNDKVDAGEIGAGHTVTALYEIVPVGVDMNGETPAVDALKYQRVPINRAPATAASKQRDGIVAPPAQNPEMLTVKIRYKDPAGDVSRKLEFPLYDTGGRFEDATQDFKFASAVAAFGMVLRDSPHKGAATLTDIAAWGRAGLGSDAGGYRNEFLGLVARSEAWLR